MRLLEKNKYRTQNTTIKLSNNEKHTEIKTKQVKNVIKM